MPQRPVGDRLIDPPLMPILHDLLQRRPARAEPHPTPHHHRNHHQRLHANPSTHRGNTAAFLSARHTAPFRNQPIFTFPSPSRPFPDGPMTRSPPTQQPYRSPMARRRRYRLRHPGMLLRVPRYVLPHTVACPRRNSRHRLQRLHPRRRTILHHPIHRMRTPRHRRHRQQPQHPTLPNPHRRSSIKILLPLASDRNSRRLCALPRLFPPPSNRPQKPPFSAPPTHAVRYPHPSHIWCPTHLMVNNPHDAAFPPF